MGVTGAVRYAAQIGLLASFAALTACGGESNSPGAVVTPSPAPTPAPTPTPVPTPSPTPLPTSISNVTAANLQIWREARARSLSGVGRAKVAFVGDSTFAGVGSGSGLFTDIKVRSLPSRLADLLTQQGLPARASSFFADNGTGGSYQLADPRIIAQWDIASNSTVIGGFAFQSIALQPFTFRPGVTADSVDIYDQARADGATINVLVQGQIVQSYPAASPGIRRTTARFNRNSAPEIAIAAANSGPTVGPIRLLAMDAYDSTKPDIALWNMGASGFRSTDWLEPIKGLGTYDPDLTLINLGINDASFGTDPTVYRANLREIIRTARETGDVVIFIPSRSNPAYDARGLQQAYEAILRELSAELGIPLVDVPAILGSFAQAKAQGWMSDDSHPNAQGYQQIATALAALLRN